MWCAIELPNIHDVVLVLQYGCFVVIDVEVVRCAEDGHDAREACGSRFAVHSIAGILSFVCSDD